MEMEWKLSWTIATTACICVYSYMLTLSVSTRPGKPHPDARIPTLHKCAKVQTPKKIGSRYHDIQGLIM